MKKILITGGAGYIGSHCCLNLLEKGQDIIIFDNLITGHMETVTVLNQYGNVEFINGDLKNINDIEKVFIKYNISSVIHFAALSQVNESVVNPQLYYYNNVIGSLNLFNSMIKHNCKKIVFSSTAAIYGEPLYSPIDELHTQNPVNPYGISKLMIEKILNSYDEAYGLKYVCLRYFNVIGADNKSRIGEWHNNETHLVPNILKSTFNNKRTFQLYGNNYDTKDGTCIRDYIDVEDLSNAHLCALEYLEKNNKSNIFNIGTNSGYSVLEIFDLCSKVTCKNIDININNRREGDVKTLVAKCEKAKKELNWCPTKSLEYSINNAYKWEKKLMLIQDLEKINA